MKKIIITGVTGMIGYEAAKKALDGGYDVYGMSRYSANLNKKIESRQDIFGHKNFTAISGDITDFTCMANVIGTIKPFGFLNFAAMSHVGESFNTPIAATNITGVGVLNILEAIRKNSPETRFITASSSEMFGDILEYPQNEDTKFNPVSPYGAAKVYAHYITSVYRQAYDLHAKCAIFYNNEWTTRDPSFFTRRITYGMRQILEGKISSITVGNLDFCRDWSACPDIVDGVFSFLSSKITSDLIFCSEETHTGEEWIRTCFNIGNRLLGRKLFNFEDHITIDSSRFRPKDVNVLCGDATRAKTLLNWKPKYSFEKIAETMVYHDIFRKEEV